MSEATALPSVPQPQPKHFTTYVHVPGYYFSQKIIKDSAALTEISWENQALGIPNVTEGACAVYLNPIQIILVGGFAPTEPWNGSQTVILNKDSDAQPGPYLLTPRMGHSCAKLDSSSPLDKPRVIAIGGWNPQEILRSTEYLNEEQMMWEEGRNFRNI